MDVTVAKMYQLQQSSDWKPEWAAYYDGKKILSIDDPKPFDEEEISEESVRAEGEIAVEEGVDVYGLQSNNDTMFDDPAYLTTGDTKVEVKIEIETTTISDIIWELRGTDIAKKLSMLLANLGD